MTKKPKQKLWWAEIRVDMTKAVLFFWSSWSTPDGLASLSVDFSSIPSSSFSSSLAEAYTASSWSSKLCTEAFICECWEKKIFLKKSCRETRGTGTVRCVQQYTTSFLGISRSAKQPTATEGRRRLDWLWFQELVFIIILFKKKKPWRSENPCFHFKIKHPGACLRHLTPPPETNTGTWNTAQTQQWAPLCVRRCHHVLVWDANEYLVCWAQRYKVMSTITGVAAHLSERERLLFRSWIVPTFQLVA